jgi:hypothetical protein
MPTLEARITVSPAPDPAPDPIACKFLIDLNILVNLTFLLGSAPAPPTKPPQPPLKSILKRKRQVVISSDDDDDDNRSDLDDGGKELPGDSDYRPGNRSLIRRDNRGQFKKARTE